MWRTVIVKRYLIYGIAFILFLSLGVSACQAAGLTSTTPTVSQSNTSSLAFSSVSDVAHTPSWKQVDADGVLLGIGVPLGWSAHRAQAGLLLAERSAPIGEDSNTAGMELHIFVSRMEQFEGFTDSVENPALHALRQAVGDNDLIGNVLATEPSSFEWDSHPAAYYLLSDGRDSLGVVIGFALEASERLVVLNLSAPKDQRESIRGRLYELLTGFTVNGDELNPDALDAIPDSLAFPDTEASSNT